MHPVNSMSPRFLAVQVALISTDKSEYVAKFCFAYVLTIYMSFIWKSVFCLHELRNNSYKIFASCEIVKCEYIFLNTPIVVNAKYFFARIGLDWHWNAIWGPLQELPLSGRTSSNWKILFLLKIMMRLWAYLTSRVVNCQFQAWMN